MTAKDPAGLLDHKIPLGQVPSRAEFRNRRGEVLSYRLFPAWSENLIVLIHGIGGDSRSLTTLARALVAQELGTVVTPDLRGHGEPSSSSRAPELSPGQLIEDLEELLIEIRRQRAVQRIFLGGHSLGASLALKLLSQGGGLFAGACLWAPALGLQARDLAEGASSWLRLHSEGLELLIPPEQRWGFELLHYPRSYLQAALPTEREWQDLSRQEQKGFVFLAEEERIFDLERQLGFFAAWPRWQSELLPGSHIGLVTGAASAKKAAEKLTGFISPL